MRKTATHAFGPEMAIERYQLDNGLALLVLVDKAAPVVSYQTWLRVGSRHERPGKTGIAHLFEHLMFNETDNLPCGEFDRRLEEMGADSNAATFLDWTFYLVNLPKDALELVVELESDRLQNLLLRDEQVDSEKEVVVNERRQTIEDDIDGTVAELLYETAFSVHSYRWPTIGRMDDIKALTTADCRRFYETYYAPNNATLVVVGDVDTTALVSLIDARYGQLQPSQIPSDQTRSEPAQAEQRWTTTRQPTANGKLAIGYKSPALSHADHAPLVLLNEVLFGGRGSRVHRSLVQQRELASEAHGYVGNFFFPALWEVHLTMRDGQDPRKVLKALDELLQRAVDEKVTNDELARACARLELATLQSLETAAGKAEQIGFSETVLGDPAALLTRLQEYRSASEADLLRVAQRYLTMDARTVVEVVADGDDS